MNVVSIVERFRFARLAAFRFRSRAGLLTSVFLSFALAGVTGLLAQVRIPLPFTPVPITGQVLAALLAGALLGGFYGGLSQGLYVGLGVLGVPWFAGATSGIPAGPSGGYLLGFIVAAYVVGRLSERYGLLRTFRGQLFVMMLGVAVIYLFGAVQFALVMRSGIRTTFLGAVIPFMPVDLAKAVIAAGISSALLPKTDYTRKH